VTSLALAALLPVLFWDGGPDTAAALRQAGIQRIAVPAGALAKWKSVDGLAAETADPQAAVKLIPPSVNYHMYDATATQAPWINSNGWRYLRNAGKRFYVDAPGAAAALAAAEAQMFAAGTMIHTDTAGLKPLGDMMAFLESLGGDSMPAVVNVGFIDDGTPMSGERMNMMVVRNLLFRPVAEPDSHLDLNVRVGSKDYPEAAWHNPDLLEHVIRANLTDEKRLLRIYGSDVVIGRLTGSADRLRVHVLNYSGARRAVDGVRVRVLGSWPKHKAHIAGAPDAELADYSADASATEFTIPELKTYAVIDLSR
jgi:hypothetical protein